MKLWQKIFISPLLLVILAVDVTAVLLLTNNHRLTVERERERSASEHAYITASLKDYVLYTRLRDNRILLNEEETLAAVRSALQTGGKNRKNGMSLYNGTVQAVSTSICSQALEQQLLQKVEGEGRVSAILEEGGTYFILTASEIQLEGRQYGLVVATDITEVYDLRSSQIGYVQWMSIGCALIVACILLIMVFWLLAPLARINHGMRRIARGNYRERLAVRGSGELAELAKTLNSMADAVEKNVEGLERVAEDRKTFIGNLAHEMKTPLTSILGFADILRIKRVVTDKERRDYASVIVEEAKRLRALSGKLMELITVGGAELDLQQVPLREMLQEAAVSLHPLLTEREIHLSCAAPDVRIHADRELFKSLIYNLVDNAAKASAPGQTVEIVSGYRSGLLYIDVRDRGIGIPEKELKRVMQPFYMVDKVRTRKSGGAGLGLALCVNIARLHHAALSIQSKVGKGTCVTILFDEEAELS